MSATKNYIRSASGLVRKHKPRAMPKPQGLPIKYSRDPYSDQYVASYGEPFQFWIVNSDLRPIKRATLAQAFRTGDFSTEREWAALQTRRRENPHNV